MAPPSPFPRDIVKWLDERVPKYLEIALKEPTFGRSSINESPSNKLLNAWYPEFEKAFEGALQALEKSGLKPARVRKSFRQHFHNHKSRAKMKMGAPPQPTQTPSPAPALVSFIGKPAVASGKSLFQSLARADANAEVVNLRRATGADHKQHAGMLNHELKARWEALSEDEQQEYEAKARDHNDKLPPQVYINQKDFVDKISDELGTLLGTGDAQLGKGALVLMYGLRRQNEKLYTGVIQAASGIPFSEDFDGYHGMTKAWKAFCRETIPLNQPVEIPEVASSTETSFLRDASGLPSWPAEWEGYSASDLKATLGDFIRLQWRLSLEPLDTTPVPWQSLALTDNASTHLAVQLPRDTVLCDPASEKPSYCMRLAEVFDTLRTADPFFRLFVRKDAVEEHATDHESAEDIDGMTPAAFDHYQLEHEDYVVASNPKSSQAHEVEQASASQADGHTTRPPHPDDDSQKTSTPVPATQTPLRSPPPSSLLRLPLQDHDAHLGLALQRSSAGAIAPACVVQGTSEGPPLTAESSPVHSASLKSTPTAPECEGQLGAEPKRTASPPPSSPSQLPTSFGVTGRRDYSPRKTRSRAAAMITTGGANPGCMPDDSTTATATAGIKRQRGAKEKVEGVQGKRQKLAESALKRSTRLRQFTGAPQGGDTTPPISEPSTRRQPKRGQGKKTASAKPAEQGNSDDDTIVTARGKKTKRKAKHWTYELVLD